MEASRVGYAHANSDKEAISTACQLTRRKTRSDLHQSVDGPLGPGTFGGSLECREDEDNRSAEHHTELLVNVEFGHPGND